MASFAEQVNAFRRRLILSALRQFHWNMSAAARSLGIHRNTMHRYVEMFGITFDSKRHWGGRRPGCNRIRTAEDSEDGIEAIK